MRGRVSGEDREKLVCHSQTTAHSHRSAGRVGGDAQGIGRVVYRSRARGEQSRRIKLNDMLGHCGSDQLQFQLATNLEVATSQAVLLRRSGTLLGNSSMSSCYFVY